jgi:pimeloyl-ACP methyl ester carboxylesterase
MGGGGMLTEMDNWVTDMRGKVIVEGAGHWVRAEQPAAVNEALIRFLRTFA